MEKYPSGRRGSPAKGVDWGNRCEGSNPSFSAKRPPHKDLRRVLLFGLSAYFPPFPRMYSQRYCQQNSPAHRRGSRSPSIHAAGSRRQHPPRSLLHDIPIIQLGLGYDFGYIQHGCGLLQMMCSQLTHLNMSFKLEKQAKGSQSPSCYSRYRQTHECCFFPQYLRWPC